MLKWQKVQDTIQVLPQPGLQAEKTNVEVPRKNTTRRFFAQVFVGGTTTRVKKTPTHQAHLEGRDNRVEIVVAPLQPSTSLVPLKGLHLPLARTCALAGRPLQILLLTWKNLYLRSRKTAPPDSPSGKEKIVLSRTVH